MRLATMLAAAALLSASPAMTSAGFECETTDGSNIVISGNMARAIAAPLNSAFACASMTSERPSER